MGESQTFVLNAIKYSIRGRAWELTCQSTVLKNHTWTRCNQTFSLAQTCLAWFIEEKSAMIVSNASNLFIDLNIWRLTCWYTLEKGLLFAENATNPFHICKQCKKSYSIWRFAKTKKWSFVFVICARSRSVKLEVWRATFSVILEKKPIFAKCVHKNTMLYFWVSIFLELRALFGIWKEIQKRVYTVYNTRLKEMIICLFPPNRILKPSLTTLG